MHAGLPGGRGYTHCHPSPTPNPARMRADNQLVTPDAAPEPVVSEGRGQFSRELTTMMYGFGDALQPEQVRSAHAARKASGCADAGALPTALHDQRTGLPYG